VLLPIISNIKIPTKRLFE